MPRVRSLVLVLSCAALFIPSAGGAGSADVVVGEIFGGGGNAGAPFKNDYVELFNRGSAPADLSGWTFQYATAAGTSWQATPLSGTLPPGGRHLVALAGGADGAALPTPDTTGTTNLSATSGKVAVVRDGTALTCGASAGSCSANATVADLVGYGSATDYEGAAAPALTSTTAGVRGAGGCTDTDTNATDITAAAPSPQSSTSAAEPCSTPPASAPTATAGATVDVDVQSVLSLSLERPTLSFGTIAAGSAPPPISERVTVLSNHPGGYTLNVHRSAFAPADLPLALQASAPAGASLGSAFAGNAFVAIPIAPTTRTIGTTSSLSVSGGDVWHTNVGFASALPAVAPGRYTATLTFTVIGR